MERDERLEQIKTELEQAKRLIDVVRSPGWQDVLSIMEARVAKAEFNLMNYNGSDDHVCMLLQRRARTMREFFQDVQQEIDTKIAAAIEVLNAK